MSLDHVERLSASVNSNPKFWAESKFSKPFHGRRNVALIAAYDNLDLLGNREHFEDMRNKLSAAVKGNDREWSIADDTLLALVAWPECAYMLDSDPGELAIIAALGDDRALMLLIACDVFAKEKALV